MRSCARQASLSGKIMSMTGATCRVASSGQTYTSNQTVCQPVTQVSEQRQIIGYDVEYRYHGDVYMSRLSYDPGERLRVRVSVSPAD